MNEGWICPRCKRVNAPFTPYCDCQVNNRANYTAQVDCINGYREHVHCLISLSSEQTIDKVAKLMKGESAFWINKQNLTDSYFAWQEEYFAISVSESVLFKSRAYIEKQEEHHRNQPFKIEREQFLERYRFS